MDPPKSSAPPRATGAVSAGPNPAAALAGPRVMSPPIPIQQRQSPRLDPEDEFEGGGVDERRPLSPSLGAGGVSSSGGGGNRGQPPPQQQHQESERRERVSSVSSAHTEASTPAANLRATLIRTATVTALVQPEVGKRRMLSDVKSFPIPHPYPKKDKEMTYKMDKPYSFIRTLFYVRGTVITSIWPQILLGVILILGIKLCQVGLGKYYTFDPRFNGIHTILGSILAFITVFRTNRSYDSYIEGRKLVSTIVNCLRTAVMDMYINDPKDGTVETRAQLVELAEDFRRKANILYAFIRQSARESKEGFCPSSDVRDMTYDAETFVLDPTRPRLVDMLTEEEHKKLSRMRVNARPVYMMSEMNLLAYRIISLSKDTMVRVNIDNKFQEILSSWNGMLRVVDLRIPFPIQHIVNLLTFIFVYTAPFIYQSTSSHWSSGDVIIFASLFLGIAFYGLENMAQRVQNPFGWDQEDHDLEAFGITLNLDSQEIAHMCGVLEPAEFMPEPLFDDLPDKYQSISYKAFTHSASLSLEGLGGDSPREIYSTGDSDHWGRRSRQASNASSV